MKSHPMVGYLMAQVAGMPGAAESPARQHQVEAFADALQPPPREDWTGIPDGPNVMGIKACSVGPSTVVAGTAGGRAYGTRPHVTEVPKALNATPYNKGQEAARRRKRMKTTVVLDWRQDELAVAVQLGVLPADVSQALEDAVLRSFGIEHGRKEAVLSQLLRGPEGMGPERRRQETALLEGAEALREAYYARGTNQVKKG